MADYTIKALAIDPFEQLSAEQQERFFPGQMEAIGRQMHKGFGGTIEDQLAKIKGIYGVPGGIGGIAALAPAPAAAEESGTLAAANQAGQQILDLNQQQIWNDPRYTTDSLTYWNALTGGR